MSTDSEIWKALHAMGDASTSAATDVLVARALNELDAKDAVIKALADALLRNGFWVDGGKDWHSRRCPQSLPPAGAPCTCPDDRQALRLAGRL